MRAVQALGYNVAAQDGDATVTGGGNDGRADRVPLAPLVGRGRELDAGRRALLRAARLLTLTGPPGIGKTRLSLALADALAARFRDGARFVPLAAVRDPALVPTAIAHALGLLESNPASITGALSAYLRERELLLVLDNFEQVLEAAPLVAELLGGSPGLRVLATSRAALRLTGEHELPVPPLSVPKPNPEEEAPSRGLARALARSEAVQLFTQRARGVRPGFSLTESNGAAVAELCRRLEGVPLALELAAARVRVLPPEALLAQLGSRLSLLTAGARDLPDRQRTLRGAITWSYDLLSPEEQRLFRILSAFRGGGGLGAIAGVCAELDLWGCSLQPLPGSGEWPVALLDMLDSLAGHSLVRREDSAAPMPEPRFSMLEMLREYGLERLRESGEEAAVRRAHAAHFRRLAAAWVGDWNAQSAGGIGQGWWDVIERDHDNLRAALDWLSATGAVEEALDLGLKLWRHWYRRGHFREGNQRLASLLDLAGEAHRPQRLYLLLALGRLAQSQGDVRAQERHTQEALALARELGEPVPAASALRGLGQVAQYRGDYARARAMAAEAAALLQGDLRPLRTLLGNVARDEGDFAEARLHYAADLEASRAAGALAAVGTTLSNLGWLDYYEGRHEESRAVQEESLAIRRAQRDERQVAVSTTALGLLALQTGDLRRARELLAESLPTHLVLEDLWGMALSLEGFAGLASLDEPLDAPRAFRLLGAADALRRRMGRRRPPPARPIVEGWLARARTALEPAAAEAAREEGMGWTPADAVAHALANPSRGTARRRTVPRAPSGFPVATPDGPVLPPPQSVQRSGATLTGDHPLSPRERQVAALIAQGMTNREIAAALMIAERTAYRHVEHILTKLGARSRAQVAAWVARLEG